MKVLIPILILLVVGCLKQVQTNTNDSTPTTKPVKELTKEDIVEANEFIVKDGKAGAEIIIAENPTRMQKLAAEELRFFIHKISGANLMISTSVTDENLVKIYVGKSSYTDALKHSTEGLKYDAYHMISGNDYLVLLGNDENATMKGPGDNIYKRDSKSSEEATEKWDKLVGHSRWVLPGRSRYQSYSRELGVRYNDQRGSLMAVYDLLRSLGARWYFPGEFGEVLPQTKTIGSAMRDGDWKLIFTTFQPPQLYDLVSDPAERNDVAAENPAVVTRMMDAHGKWCNSFERAPIWLGVDNHSRLHRKEYQLTQPEVSPK